jgi:hypothetical protein
MTKTIETWNTANLKCHRAMDCCAEGRGRGATHQAVALQKAADLPALVNERYYRNKEVLWQRSKSP